MKAEPTPLPQGERVSGPPRPPSPPGTGEHGRGGNEWLRPLMDRVIAAVADAVRAHPIDEPLLADTAIEEITTFAIDLRARYGDVTPVFSTFSGIGAHREEGQLHATMSFHDDSTGDLGQPPHTLQRITVVVDGGRVVHVRFSPWFQGKGWDENYPR